MKDLGLTYEQAAHGIQSAIKWEIDNSGKVLVSDHIKHLRVGLNCRASDHAALADLLMAKGLMTQEEYLEAMRLRMNDELAMTEAYMRERFDLPAGADFR